jgi:hypothetical protein
MKKVRLLTLFVVMVGPLAFAQIDLSENFMYVRPQQSMGNFIRQAAGLQLQGLYLIPKSPFAVGANIGVNFYGNQKTRQTYTFTDGSQTETNVKVSNQYFSFNLVGRADLLKSGIFIPYVTGQVGFNEYWTNLTIEDPEDEDGCDPLENKILLKDGAFSITGGAGVRWDLGSVIKKAGTGRFFVDLSAEYTQGGKVSYMNVEIPSDPAPAAHHHTPATSDNVTAFQAKFVNPTSQVVHEHHVGDVYTSPIQQVNFKLGVMYRLKL